MILIKHKGWWHIKMPEEWRKCHCGVKPTRGITGWKYGQMLQVSSMDRLPAKIVNRVCKKCKEEHDESNVE
jgi:hypothetical protein